MLICILYKATASNNEDPEEGYYIVLQKFMIITNRSVRLCRTCHRPNKLIKDHQLSGGGGTKQTQNRLILSDRYLTSLTHDSSPAGMYCEEPVEQAQSLKAVRFLYDF